MKTSTAFAGGLAENDYDLHTFMNALLEKDESFRKDYGFQKIWHTELKDYLGVAGLIRCKNVNIVEYGMFIKSEYNNRGFGVYLLKTYFEKERKRVIISSVWIKNYPCMKIVERYGMRLINKISKIYNNRVVDLNVYVKYSSNVFEVSDIENALITKQLT